MKRIFKYALPIETECFIAMPRGAKVLCVQVQGMSGPMVWALVDDDETVKAKRWFYVYGTGHETYDGGVYLGTFQMNDGAAVFHVFDNGEGAYIAAGPKGSTER